MQRKLFISRVMSFGLDLAIAAFWLDWPRLGITLSYTECWISLVFAPPSCHLSRWFPFNFLFNYLSLNFINKNLYLTTLLNCPIVKCNSSYSSCVIVLWCIRFDVDVFLLDHFLKLGVTKEILVRKCNETKQNSNKNRKKNCKKNYKKNQEKFKKKRRNKKNLNEK